MKQIMGGASFTCYCGFAGGPYQNMTFSVNAGNINQALNIAGPLCGGLGATCSGS
tara:strand:+ start:98 stop:262 length:165 start_codon:yes stop_codon:yes gene_type:complete